MKYGIKKTDNEAGRKLAELPSPEGVISTQTPVGGQALVAYPRGWCWGQYCVMFSLMVWLMGPSAPSASLQTMPNQEEWLIHEGCAAVHRDLDGLERWDNRVFMVLREVLSPAPEEE